jgi:hypothetical protein
MLPAMAQWVLGYDSYRVDDAVHAFDSAPAARDAFERALAKARKSKSKKKVAVDATPDGPQADREHGKLVRVWVTALETHDKVPDRLASEQLAALDLSATREIGVGLQQWHDSHRASFDPIFDIIDRKRPPLAALALGDYDNRGGHIMRVLEPARLATLGLRKLRITTTQITKLPPMALEYLGVGWKHSKSLDDWAWLAGIETDTLHLLGTADDALVAQLARLTKAKISVAPRFDGIRE